MKTIESKPNMIQLMRDIRDQFSLDIHKMSLEQQKEYMLKFLKEVKEKRNKYSVTKDKL